MTAAWHSATVRQGPALVEKVSTGKGKASRRIFSPIHRVDVKDTEEH